LRLSTLRAAVLVAAAAQLLAVFSLPARESAVRVAEFALLGAPLGLAHGHRVLLQRVLHLLQLLRRVRQLLVALLDLGLDFLLRLDRRRGVAQDALGVDEAEFPGERRLVLCSGRRR